MQSQTTRNLIAASLVVSAMALFGLIDNFIRLAAESGGLWQFHFLRSILALACIWGIAVWRGIALRPKSAGRVLLRSALTSIAMVIYFGCLGFMPIAQVVAGLFTAPIFVVVFSVLFFGEKVGPRRTIAVAIGFAGAILAIRPEASAFTVWTILPVLAGAIYAMGNIATRRWCEGEGTFTLLGGFFLTMTVWGFLGVSFLAIHPLPVPEGGDGFITRGWSPLEGIFLVIIIVQGIGSVLGVGLTIRAYQLAEAAFVAVFENMLLVFATLWAIILWGDWPDALGFLGLFLILVAGVTIALRSDAPPPEQAAGVAE